MSGCWLARAMPAAMQALDLKRARILCLRGGRFCDQEFARQPHLVTAIKQEMSDETFRVKVGPASDGPRGAHKKFSLLFLFLPLEGGKTSRQISFCVRK